MAKTAQTNYKPVIIIGSILILAGVGYLLYRKYRKGSSSGTDEDILSIKPGTTPSVTPTTTQYVPSPERSYPATPFKSTAEGNAFRTWVNLKHPDWAKDNDLDKTGAYDNAYIRKAWYTYGSDYRGFIAAIVATITAGGTVTNSKDVAWWNTFGKSAKA